MKDSEIRKNYTLLPVGENHNCFGCSGKNEAGLQMKFCINEKKDAVVSWLTVPEHMCGWGNIAHGGIVSTILDEAMGWAGLVLLSKLALTKTLSVEFLAPVFIGKEIRVEGSVTEIVNEKEAVLQGIIYNGNVICAKASCVCSLFTFESIRKTGVTDEETLIEIEEMVKKYGLKD